jgi:hypothetical protein
MVRQQGRSEDGGLEAWRLSPNCGRSGRRVIVSWKGGAAMRRVALLMFAGLAAFYGAPLVAAQSLQDDSTDIRIRRWAGLPAASATGQIQITDVGHNPSDTMVSIVANRTANGWSVSYACASSPYCSTDLTSDHDARSYTLSSSNSDQVDIVLKKLSTGSEAGGVEPTPRFVGGYAYVSINYQGFRHSYTRGSSYGDLLRRLRSLLSPPPR